MATEDEPKDKPDISLNSQTHQRLLIRSGGVRTRPSWRSFQGISKTTLRRLLYNNKEWAAKGSFCWRWAERNNERCSSWERNREKKQESEVYEFLKGFENNVYEICLQLLQLAHHIGQIF